MSTFFEAIGNQNLSLNIENLLIVHYFGGAWNGIMANFSLLLMMAIIENKIMDRSKLHNRYSITSTTFRIYHWSLVLCLFFIADQLVGQNPMFSRSTTRAVIVGISDYQNISDLDYAHRDAEAFNAYLRSSAGGEVPAENIQLLLNEKATHMQFGMALDWLWEESQPGDRAYIYFSGHGDVERKKALQRGFLLNYDAPKTTYMAGGAFPVIFLQDIVSTLSTEKEVQVILITDACRAGKLAGSSIGGNQVTAEKLAEMFAKEIKILSCQSNELSQEGTQWGGGRGAFSYHLIEGLIGLADDSQDQQVSLKEIRNYLEEQVGLATGNKQMPKVVGDLNQPLADVDEESLKQLQLKKATEGVAHERSIAMRSPIDPDTTVLELYRQFETALQNKHLLYPEDGAAYTIYELIKEESIIQARRGEMKRNLAIALHDEAQQAINNYLSASPREIRQRWSYNERYSYYPEFLGKAAELLGSDHFMFTDLKTRQLYFEGLKLRLQAEREDQPALFQEALKKQEKAINQDASAAYAYNELGILYRRLKQQKQATKYFLLANQNSPTWILPLVNLIANYTDLGQLDDAIVVGKQALALDSTFALTNHNLGYAFEKGKDWSKAIEYYHKAVEYDPEYSASLYNLGLAYFQEGQLDQTESYFLKYAEKSSGDASIWSDLGYIADRQDKEKAAQEYFQKALSTDPEYAGTYLNMGEFYLRHARLDEAAAAYQSYVNKRPDRALGHYMLAAVWARQGKSGQALDRLELAIDKGFKDGVKLEEDEYFDSLREMERYKLLIKNLK